MQETAGFADLTRARLSRVGETHTAPKLCLRKAGGGGGGPSRMLAQIQHQRSAQSQPNVQGLHRDHTEALKAQANGCQGEALFSQARHVQSHNHTHTPPAWQPEGKSHPHPAPRQRQSLAVAAGRSAAPSGGPSHAPVQGPLRSTPFSPLSFHQAKASGAVLLQPAELSAQQVGRILADHGFN